MMAFLLALVNLQCLFVGFYQELVLVNKIGNTAFSHIMIFAYTGQITLSYVLLPHPSIKFKYYRYISSAYKFFVFAINVSETIYSHSFR